LPAWQAGANPPASVNDGRQRRTIPDVAGNAGSASAYNIVLNGAMTTAYGTSAVAPLYAGLAAVLNAKLGRPVGFLNPTLYANPNLCRGVADRVSNATNGANGYRASPGFNACTGLGCVNGARLYAALGGA
jgi:kumamolisin